MFSHLNKQAPFFHDRVYIKHAFLALLQLVINSWLRYLSILREEAEGMRQKVEEAGGKVEGGH